jgi:hypothetical protein
VLGSPREQNAPVMKKNKTETLRRSYRLDYSKARPNRFAKGLSLGTVTVVLDADVATRFKDSRSVNRALRALLRAEADARSTTPAP